MASKVCVYNTQLVPESLVLLFTKPTDVKFFEIKIYFNSKFGITEEPVFIGLLSFSNFSANFTFCLRVSKITAYCIKVFFLICCVIVSGRKYFDSDCNPFWFINCTTGATLRINYNYYCEFLIAVNDLAVVY